MAAAVLKLISLHIFSLLELQYDMIVFKNKNAKLGNHKLRPKI